jgi:hypothetical protein
MGCVFEAMINKSEPEVLAGKRVAYTLQRNRAKRAREDLIDSKLGNIPLAKLLCRAREHRTMRGT